MIRRLILVLSLLVTVGLLGNVQQPVAQAAPFETVPCPAPLSAFAQDGTAVICNLIEVPAEHAQPNGPTVKVMAAVIPAADPGAPVDPIVIQQGGPGGSTISTLGPLLFLTPGGAQLRASRDVILIEARGTRYAEPFLFCDEAYDDRIQRLQANTDLTDIAFEDQLQHILDCKTRLEGDGIDYDWFDSVEAANDIPVVMDTLGHTGQFNFYGISYATLVGQHLLLDHESRLRSVVLDGVVPVDESIGAQGALNAERAFDVLFAECNSVLRCANRYPDLEQTFTETAAALDANPATVTLTSRTGVSYDTQLTGRGMVTILFNMLYDSRTYAPAIPDVIYEASEGDYSSLVRFVEQGVFDRSFADGLQSAALCSDDGQREAVLGSAASVYANAFTTADEYFNACEALALEPTGPQYDQSVSSSVPVLLYSGAFDPVTPPSGGDAVAAALGNARHITFANGGHGQLFYSACASNIATQFFDSRLVSVNAACANMQPVFYTDAPRRATTNNMDFNVPGSWITRSYLDPSLFEDGPRSLQIGVVDFFNPTLIPDFLSSLLGEIGESNVVEVTGRSWVVTDYTGADGLGSYYAYTVENDLTYGIVVRGPQAELEDLYSTALLLTMEDFTILGPPSVLVPLQ